MTKAYIAYISSTLEDLQECRAAAELALRRSGFDITPVKESPVAVEGQSVASALAEVAESDVYLGIFAWRYGYIPEGHNQSLTELEYRRAVELGKPCLIFLLSEDAPWPVRLIDRGPTASRIEALRDELMRRHLCAFFGGPEDLAEQVSMSVRVFVRSMPLPSSLEDEFGIAALSRYFERLRQRYGRLSLEDLTRSPRGVSASPLLTELFVDPWLSEIVPRSDDTDSDDELTQQIQPREQDQSRRRLLEIITQPLPRTLVILGSPGAGKTTLARYVALRLAAETPDRGSPLAEYLPLLIELRAYSAATEAGSVDGFIGYLDLLAKTTGLGLPMEPLSRYLRTNGRAMVVFDGLDEVFDHSLRVSNRGTRGRSRCGARWAYGMALGVV